MFTPDRFSAFLSKGYNFHDFLFAFWEGGFNLNVKNLLFELKGVN